MNPPYGADVELWLCSAGNLTIRFKYFNSRNELCCPGRVMRDPLCSSFYSWMLIRTVLNRVYAGVSLLNIQSILT